jgi:hypothetical protein
MSGIKILSAVLLTLIAATSGAQTIFKCTVQGKVSYGATPCAAGESVEIKVPSAPADRDGHVASLARQKDSADRLERERHKREAADEREQERAGRAAAVYRKKCGLLKLNVQWAAEDAAGASADVANKAAGKAKIKARRAAQKLALECPA